MSDSNGSTPRTFYRICNWNEKYEVAQSRPLQHLFWIARPISITSSDYAELMHHPNGAAHYGIWHAIIELAAQCQPRGSLLKPGGTPHLQTSIALALRCSEGILQESINQFLSLGWLEEVPFTKQAVSAMIDRHQPSKGTLQTTKENLQTSMNNARAREQNRTEHKNTPPPPSSEGGARRPTRKEIEQQKFRLEQQERLRNG